MLWPFFALTNAILYGGLMHANRHWQLPGAVLARWRCLVPSLIALCFTPFFAPPSDPMFYVMSLGSASLILFHDGRAFDVSAKYGANVSLRMRPLILPVIFIFWLVFHPAQIDHLLETPWLSAGILSCLLLATFFLMRLRKCDISRSALRDMVPILIAAAGLDLFNKSAMGHADFPNNTIYYTLIVSAVPLAIGAFTYTGGAKQMVTDMATIPGRGIFLGVFWTVMMVAKNIALMLVSNPAYYTAVALTAPFWISLWMKLRGEKEEADWVSGTALLLSIIVLVVLTSFLKV